MTKAVLVNFHQYTPFGDEYYRPIFDFFIKNYREIWGKEVDKLYILASNWNVDYAEDYTIIPTDPHMRYYDAYKAVLREGLIKEDAVLFMDNDMVVYKPGKVDQAFRVLVKTHLLKDVSVDFEKREITYSAPGHGWDVASIYDTIGSYTTDKLNGKNKFCPYWFAAKKDTLMKYLDVDWSPDAMPYTETFGLLTEAMLNDGLKPFEFEEDKSNILFDGIQDGEKSKDLGYYHIRSGSLPAYLLATKKYGDIETYKKYLENQPRNEYLRQCAFYEYMGGDPTVILLDAKVDMGSWSAYMDKFEEYHGL